MGKALDHLPQCRWIGEPGVRPENTQVRRTLAENFDRADIGMGVQQQLIAPGKVKHLADDRRARALAVEVEFANAAMDTSFDAPPGRG